MKKGAGTRDGVTRYIYREGREGVVGKKEEETSMDG